MITMNILGVPPIYDIINQYLTTHEQRMLAWTCVHLWNSNRYILEIKAKYVSEIEEIGQLARKKTVHLCCWYPINKTLEDVSALIYVHTLILGCCYKVKDISMLTQSDSLHFHRKAEDVDIATIFPNGFKNDYKVTKLNISCSKISDLTILSHLYAVDISGCENINDVSCLKHVHTLNLSETEVSDVSCLGPPFIKYDKYVHTLNLNYCYNLIDVSGLGNIHTLSLTECENIKDISGLGFKEGVTKGVHTLDINSCIGIEDISSVCNVYNLTLSYNYDKEIDYTPILNRPILTTHYIGEDEWVFDTYNYPTTFPSPFKSYSPKL